MSNEHCQTRAGDAHVPIERIEVLNSRDRNAKVFEEIVENIQEYWPQKANHSHRAPGFDMGSQSICLVCGEGRLNAFRLLGETHIPALDCCGL